jgi:hypothetical protein
MSTEGALNPIPILVHVLAIAAGLIVGFMVMDRINPNFPSSDTEPGIESSAAPSAVAGDDPDSLFFTANLLPALSQLDDQLAAGQGVVTLHIEPGAISVKSSDADGTFDLSDISPGTPALLAEEIHMQRDRVTLEDIGSMDLVATRKGPRWYVQLDTSRTDVDPPWTYGAPLGGAPLEVGGAQPKPIGD